MNKLLHGVVLLVIVGIFALVIARAPSVSLAPSALTLSVAP